MKYLGLDEATKLMTWNNTDPGFSLRFCLQNSFCFHRKIERLSTVHADNCLSDNVRANMGRGITRADLVERLNSLKVFSLSFNL